MVSVISTVEENGMGQVRLKIDVRTVEEYG